MSKTTAELYEDLTAALHALEQAGENPARGYTVFASGERGLRGENGSVRWTPEKGWYTVMGDE